jgi:hypothetical protein
MMDELWKPVIAAIADHSIYCVDYREVALTKSHDLTHAVGLHAKAAAAMLETEVVPALGWTG